MSKKRGGQKRRQVPRLPDQAVNKDAIPPNKWELRHFVLAVVGVFVGALISGVTIYFQFFYRVERLVVITSTFDLSKNWLGEAQVLFLNTGDVDLLLTDVSIPGYFAQSATIDEPGWVGAELSDPSEFKAKRIAAKKELWLTLPLNGEEIPQFPGLGPFNPDDIEYRVVFGVRSTNSGKFHRAGAKIRVVPKTPTSYGLLEPRPPVFIEFDHTTEPIEYVEAYGPGGKAIPFRTTDET